MYWKNFSKIVATFALAGPLVGTALSLLPLFPTTRSLVGFPTFWIKWAFLIGFPIAFLTGALFAFLALSHSKRHFLHAWLSALVANVCVTIVFGVMMEAGPRMFRVLIALDLTLLIPSLAAATICWLLATRWLNATSVVTAPE
ncbi:hypothetical protein [Methylosinus sp. LW4]|uniref:hypothetical protein n=1 Tax=Methylosinus sp. LW4 TaxID=136993 RepID=UPI000369822D|nr:hypothetical protein [Methylosinus sp. LW4]